MGLFNELRKAVFNRTDTMPVQTFNPVTGQSGTANIAVRRSPNDKRTKDELHFSQYVPAITYDHRSGRYYFHQEQPVSREMLNAIVSDAGELFSKDGKAKLVELAAENRRCDVMMEENAFQRVRAALPAYLQSELDSSIAAGRQPSPAPSYGERLNQTVSVRQAIHKRKRELMAEAFAIIKPAVETFSKFAWSAAREQEKAERSGVSRWGVTQFQPSQILRSLSYLALRSREIVTRFEDNAMVTISADPFALWGYLLEGQPANPALRAMTMQEVRREQAAVEESRTQEQLEREEKNKAEQLAKINALNDSIRNRIPGEEHFGYSVHVAPKPEATDK